MAKTVGITTGIVTRLILEGKISRRGVLSPIYKEIYEPTLKELQRNGIELREESNRVIDHRPKLWNSINIFLIKLLIQ